MDYRRIALVIVVLMGLSIAGFGLLVSPQEPSPPCKPYELVVTSADGMDPGAHPTVEYEQLSLYSQRAFVISLESGTNATLDGLPPYIREPAFVRYKGELYLAEPVEVDCGDVNSGVGIQPGVTVFGALVAVVGVYFLVRSRAEP